MTKLNKKFYVIFLLRMQMKQGMSVFHEHEHKKKVNFF